MNKEKLLDILILKLEESISNSAVEGCNSGCILRDMCHDLEEEINMDLCVALDILKERYGLYLN